MCIPAGLPRHAVAAHRLVAREQVLEGARDDMVHAGAGVRRRRPFEEDIGLVFGPLLHALAERIVLLPEAEHFLLHAREALSRIHWFEHGSFSPGSAGHEKSPSQWDEPWPVVPPTFPRAGGDTPSRL